MVGHQREDHSWDGGMTLADQNQPEVREPKPYLLGPKSISRIGCWNVRTMYECGKAAQVANEIQQNRVDILGVCESRWTGNGRVVLADGTTILYSGRQDGQHQGGVALMLNRLAAKALLEWKPVSERIVRARFYSKYSKLTVIQCYSPTNEADEVDKLNFYEQLQSEVAITPTHDVLMVIGDLNAKVGRDNIGREDHMGKHGSGEMNENGELFADFCGLNGLVIAGTIFPHKEIHKTTWTSPDKRTKNQIDHITINSRWRTSLLDTRVFRGADIGSDHMLVVGRLRLKLRKVAKTSVRRKLDLDKLKVPATQREFSLRLQNRFEVLAEMGIQEEETGVEDIWQSVKNIYMETGKEVLGYPNMKRKEWISADTWALAEERKELKKQLLSNIHHNPAEDLQQQY
ncbi:craniofacial development protein 2-like [Montipora foliosa]|uniref:craniofacial development protein 2-like n=1 Tax=Montipora foliosa TaxID=591990 RepID=UPI0035F19CF6